MVARVGKQGPESSGTTGFKNEKPTRNPRYRYLSTKEARNGRPHFDLHARINGSAGVAGAALLRRKNSVTRREEVERRPPVAFVLCGKLMLARVPNRFIDL